MSKTQQQHNNNNNNSSTTQQQQHNDKTLIADLQTDKYPYRSRSTYRSMEHRRPSSSSPLSSSPYIAFYCCVSIHTLLSSTAPITELLITGQPFLTVRSPQKHNPHRSCVVSAMWMRSLLVIHDRAGSKVPFARDGYGGEFGSR